jgi:peptidoglycan/LPS O-acetylase OafA/YrhL
VVNDVGAAVPERRASRGATDGRYYPALDGIRALSMIVIFVFHLSASAIPGGYIAVDVFFVLSGFIITRLLLVEYTRRGAIKLGAFWSRRAKRLLPGLFLMLATLALFSMIEPAVVSPYTIRSDGIATLLYYANWHFLSGGHPYFAALGGQSPLLQTWTLAIEEQFYLCWPLLLVAIGWLARRFLPKAPSEESGRARRQRSLLLTFGIPTAVLAFGSVISMMLVSHLGADVNAAYYSTECRGIDLLLGALAAIVIQFGSAGDRMGRLVESRSRLLQAVGLLGAAVLFTGMAVEKGPPGWIFSGGMALFDLGIVLMMVASLAPGPIRAVLALRPLQWTGRVSYELYLWHFPVILIVARELPAVPFAGRVALDAALTLGLAAVTYHLVDVPLRRASYATLRRRLVLPTGVLVTGSLLVASVPAVASVGEEASALGRTAATSITVRSVFGEVLPAPVGSLRHVPAPTKRSPLRLMFLGDSVMYQLELAASAGLEATGEVKTVSLSAIPGWSPRSSLPWSYFSKAIARRHPQVIVAMWTQDNAYSAAHGSKGEQAIMDRLLAVLLHRGDGVDGVVLVSEPPQPPSDSFMAVLHADVYSPRGDRLWEAAARGEATRLPGTVAYLPVTAVLQRDGGYSTWLRSPSGAWKRVRQIDDFHLCLNGAVRYGMAVDDGIERLLRIPPPTGEWWHGRWTEAVRFDHLPGYPPGQCPDDLPPWAS